MKKQAFKIGKILREEFQEKTADSEVGQFEFILNLDKIDHRKGYKLIADLIEDAWSVSDVHQEESSIVITAKRRKKKQFVFPKQDTHFNKQKDRYQFHTLMAALNFLKDKRVAVDAGGHIGLYSAALLDSFEKVYAFEPAPSNFECFKKNTPGAQLFTCGLGQKAEKVKLNLASDNSGNNSIVEDFNGKSLEIEIKTLDSFKLENVDLIKIDVQGYEEQVLRGAEQTIQKYKPVIIVELITHKNSLPNQGAFKLLKKYGYENLIIMGKDYVMGHPDREKPC